MPRLRKSKRPTDNLSSASTSPAELVQNLTSQRNSNALAASSVAIALSIASPSYDTRDTSSGEPTIRERGTAWKKAYSAARVAVEITKESSGMFLPLRAVAGAMSVLIKNYDVSESCP